MRQDDDQECDVREDHGEDYEDAILGIKPYRDPRSTARVRKSSTCPSDNPRCLAFELVTKQHSFSDR